jgi:acetylcholinesterase
MADFLVNFVNNLNPNGRGGHLDWPAYNKSSPNLMTFLDGPIPETITKDTFREEPIAYLTHLSLASSF